MSNKTRLEEQKERTIARLISEGILRSKDVIRALRTVPREEFLPDDLKEHAYVDTPLPIGCSQTISAIHMVGIMNEELELRIGQKILEVGAGCGYHASTVAEIVAPSGVDRQFWGHVFTVDIVPTLVDVAQKNLEKTGYSDRVTIMQGDGSLGLPSKAPFDGIYVTAAAPNIPPPLLDQLKPGGILLIPIGELHFFQSLFKFEKHLDGKVSRRNLGSVAFVPLLGEFGFK